MAIAAFMVSVCALGLTIWQGLLTRRHNRLSVRPYVVSSWHRRAENDGVYFTYELLNVGLGPAVINEFTLTAKDFKPTPGGGLIEELVAHAFRGSTVQYVLKRHGLPSRGYCLKAGEVYVVGELYLPRVSLGHEAVRTADAILRSLELTVSYSSFYGERFVFPS